MNEEITWRSCCYMMCNVFFCVCVCLLYMCKIHWIMWIFWWIIFIWKKREREACMNKHIIMSDWKISLYEDWDTNSKMSDEITRNKNCIYMRSVSTRKDLLPSQHWNVWKPSWHDEIIFNVENLSSINDFIFKWNFYQWICLAIQKFIPECKQSIRWCLTSAYIFFKK